MKIRDALQQYCHRCFYSRSRLRRFSGAVLFWIVYDVLIYSRDFIVKIPKVKDILRNLKETGDDRQSAVIISDLVWCVLRYHMEWHEYAFYHFERRSAAERQTYYTSYDRIRFCMYVNNMMIGNTVFEEKQHAYERFSKYFKREAILIATAEDYPMFVQFTKKFPKFFKKLSNGNSGTDAEIVDVLHCSNLKEVFDKLIQRNSCCCEQIIIQDESLGSFHAESVNTLRVTTLRLTNHDLRFISGGIRFGKDGVVVDNGVQGGIMTCVDFEQGVIVSHGFDRAGHVYLEHPNSKLAIRGFKVPRLDEALVMVKELANIFPDVRLVGWDLALTSNGWALVEANHHPGMLWEQAAYGKGLSSQFNGLLETIRSNVLADDAD